jgi:hypothetical protein
LEPSLLEVLVDEDAAHEATLAEVEEFATRDPAAVEASVSQPLQPD